MGMLTCWTCLEEVTCLNTYTGIMKHKERLLPTFFSVGHSKQAMPRLAFHIPATVEIPTFLSVGGSPIVFGGRTPENREETIRWLAAIGSCKSGLINA